MEVILHNDLLIDLATHKNCVIRFGIKPVIIDNKD
jgi:hypothetical protein